MADRETYEVIHDIGSFAVGGLPAVVVPLPH
jgi:hypothetical protein